MRQSKNKGKLISAELCTKDTYAHWFSNIQGLTNSSIFVDGLSGMLYHSDGSDWKCLNSNTNIPIGETIFIDDLFHIAAGQSTLITGNLNIEFHAKKFYPGNLTFYTICQFYGDIFVGTEEGIKTVDPKSGRLQKIVAEVPEKDVFALQVIDQVMWSFGAHHAFRFDGSRWDSFDHLI